MFSVIHMDQSLDKVIFHIIGLTKCSKSTRPYQPVVYRANVEDKHSQEGGINFDYLPQTEESEKLKKWGAGMVQGQVFLKRGEADIFPI